MPSCCWLITVPHPMEQAPRDFGVVSIAESRE